jgi:DNA-directed RNA polymerase
MLDNEEKKVKLLKWEKIELEKFLSKKLVEQNIIGLADIFVDIPEIFIPIRMDYRGRIWIYCEPEYLNYQSTDLAKSLLLFAKGDKILKSDIYSINYLKIFGANCYGNKLDKKSFEDRILFIIKSL